MVSSDELLKLESIPDTLLVVGAGAVGLEWALIYAYLGSKVTVVEIMDSIVPGTDREIADILKNELIKQNITIYTSTAISNPRIGDKVGLDFKKGDKEWQEDFSKVLLAVGRIPNSAGLFAENFPLPLDPKGFIPVSAEPADLPARNIRLRRRDRPAAPGPQGLPSSHGHRGVSSPAANRSASTPCRPLFSLSPKWPRSASAKTRP